VIRGLRTSVLCTLLLVGSGVTLAATPDECAALRKHGRNTEAHACYEALTQQRDPYLRAEGYWGLEMYQQANDQFRAAVAQSDSSALYRVRWGRLLHERFNNTDADNLFKEALARDPRNAQAYLGLALVSADGFDNAAIQWGAKALELDPGNIATETDLGVALLQLGRIEEAISHLQRALGTNPGFAKARSNLGTAYLQEGRADEAAAQFNEALAADPGNFATITDLGTAYVQKGQMEKAEAEFERALQINPDFASALTNLGNVLQLRGRIDEAVARYERALRVEPNSAVTHNNLANALLKRGRYEDAIAHFRRALEIRPNYTEARRGLGAALLEKSRAEHASLPRDAPSDR